MGVLEISSIFGNEGKRSLNIFFKLASWAMAQVLANSKQVVVKVLIKRML
jgi:hypothetical protein